MTAPAPGAVGLIQLHGAGAAETVEQLTGRRPDRRCRLADLGGIDEGLVACLHDGWCQVMPHGGPRVMARLAERLAELGARPADDIAAPALYPEADSALEADMLLAVATAASPAAIDPLADQPGRWRRAVDAGVDWQHIDRVTAAMQALVRPRRVCLVGRANVGKSTLTNLVTGRAASVASELPGTTRDWVGGLAELPTPVGELVVQWIDTPGLRHSNDPIEQRAIELARAAVDQADLLVAVRDPQTDRPPTLPERPTVHVWNKADLAPPPAEAGRGWVETSATEGRGLDELGAAVAAALGLRGDWLGEPWAFSRALRRIVADRDTAALARYTAAE